MPICDAYISEGALSPGVERELLGRITDLLLAPDGVPPPRPPPPDVRRRRPGEAAALPLRLPGSRGPVQRRAPCRGDRGDDPGRGRGGGRLLAASRAPRGGLHL